MNTNKISVKDYHNTILIDLHTEEKIFNQDVVCISRLIKNNFHEKLNVIAVVSGNYILCEKAKKFIAHNQHKLGKAIAFVIPNTERQINDLYYAKFYFLKDKNVAYFSSVEDAYSWIKSS